MKSVRSFFKRIPATIWLLLGMLLLCAAYEYWRVLHMRPLPHHLWRQTTCLSLAREYAQGEWNLFRPGVQAIIAQDLSSGKSAGEFPILYYVVGMIWKVTGQSEFVFRALMLALHFGASFCLFRLAQRVVKDAAWAVLITLFFFTVPAVVYFTLAFLPDVPAFDFVLIGAWAVAIYLEEGGRRWLVAGTLAFALAGLLKVTALMVPLALFGTFVVALVATPRSGHALFPRSRMAHVALAQLLVFAISAAWVYYAFQYDRWNSASYSVMGTWAYWDLTPEQRLRALTFGRNILVFQLFDTPAWIALGGMLILMVAYWRRANRYLLLFLGTLLAGTVLYTLLWTIALDNHDYYFIAPLVLPITLVIGSIWLLRRSFPAVYRSAWTKAAFALLVAYHGAYAANNHQMRTHGEGDLNATKLLPIYHDAELQHWQMTRYWQLEGLLDIVPMERAAGVRPEDLIITVPDESVCNALYLADQRGFNEFGKGVIDSADISVRKALGARYLYVLGNDSAVLARLHSWMDHPILHNKDVRVYDLRSYP